MSSGARDAEIVAFDVGDAKTPGVYQVGVLASSRATGLELQGYESAVTTDTTAKLGATTPFPLGTWVTLRMEVDLPARTFTLKRIDVGGEMTLSAANLTLTSAVPVPATRGEVAPGLYAYAIHSGWTARFDDIVIRSK